ncbi:putative leader peptide [Streptomyces eurythermus]|uniref:putative leader peptide n=1 Tax=Streptomyces eurythermus TaxID=42237 RepID=UPI0036D3BD61
MAFASGLRRFRAPAPRPRGDTRLTKVGRHAVLPIVTDTYVRLWRRVHMDLVRYAGCVCRPSC